MALAACIQSQYSFTKQLNAISASGYIARGGIEFRNAPPQDRVSGTQPVGWINGLFSPTDTAAGVGIRADDESRDLLPPSRNSRELSAARSFYERAQWA